MLIVNPTERPDIHWVRQRVNAIQEKAENRVWPLNLTYQPSEISNQWTTLLCVAEDMSLITGVPSSEGPLKTGFTVYKEMHIKGNCLKNLPP